LLKNRKVKFDASILNADNKAGKTPLDMALTAFKGGFITIDALSSFIDMGANRLNQDSIPYLIDNHPELALKIFEANPEYITTKQLGEYPVERAIAKGDDKLANYLIGKMPDEFFSKADLLGKAYEQGMESTCAALYPKCLQTKEDTINFINNPTGDGRSVFDKFTTGAWKFNQSHFDMFYRAHSEYHKDTMTNTLEQTTSLGQNLLYSALMSGLKTGDYRAADAVCQVIETEGLKKHGKVVGIMDEASVELLLPFAKGLAKYPKLAMDIAEEVTSRVSRERLKLNHAQKLCLEHVQPQPAIEMGK
jgi:hypothetical protein